MIVKLGMTWNRWAALLTGATAAAHLGLALSGVGASLILTFVLIGMAVWCLMCAGHLWKSNSARNCLLAAGGGLAMIVLHVGMMNVGAQATDPGMAGMHHHDMAAIASPVDPMAVAMGLGIVAEVVLVGGAVGRLLHSRRSARMV